MHASVTEQCRVWDEAFRCVNHCRQGIKPVYITGVNVPAEEAPANFVPAAAVIRGVLALFGIIGRKGCVGGNVSQLLNPGAQPQICG